MSEAELGYVNVTAQACSYDEGRRGVLKAGGRVELLDMYPSVKIVARALETIGSEEEREKTK